MRVVLDPNDWESMISLMDRHYEFDSVISARNTNGEFVSISIHKDKMEVDRYANRILSV